MTKITSILFVSILILTGCKKNNGPKLSGTETIDNKLYGAGPYYAMGFSFPAEKKISTLNSPLDVITINAFINVNGTANFDKTYFDVQNFDNSFFLYGNYADASAASFAFKNLTSFNVTQWKATGDGVKENQIWLFKTSNETYVKFRITSSAGEVRNTIPFVECTFEWVHQPDGSLTFPGK
jgi:hypothetical protein